MKYSQRFVGGMAVLGLALTGCGHEDAEVGMTGDRLVVSHANGVAVLDADSLKQLGSVPAEHKVALSLAGSGKQALLADSEVAHGRVRVLDVGSNKPAPTDFVFQGEEPGHVVVHDGQIAIFDDESGRISVLSNAALSDSKPQIRVVEQRPHHGVAVPLSGQRILTSVPGQVEGQRLGVAVLGPDGREMSRFEQCPAVHGEARVGSGPVFAFGCGDGVLAFDDTTKAVRKAVSPVPNGRVATLAGSPESAVVLGDYAVNEDKHSHTVSLTDTAAGTVRTVDIGAEYHGLARGPRGEALILATDGKLHILDPATGAQIKSIPVLSPWEKPADWKVARPELAVLRNAAYITDPTTSTLRRVDLTTDVVGQPHPLGFQPDRILAVPGH